jgi:hypothetical protein
MGLETYVWFLRRWHKACQMEGATNSRMPSLRLVRKCETHMALQGASHLLCMGSSHVLRAWLEKMNTATYGIVWIIQRLTEWRSSKPFSPIHTDLPGLQEAIEAQDCIGWLAFFEGCIAVGWTGIQEAHFLWLGLRNTGKRWATSLVVKLWEVTWDMWDHRNQIKYNLETAQNLAQRDSILLAVCSEYAVGRSGLPRRDWRLFKRPLLYILASLLHYLDTWLLRVKTACARHRRQTADGNNPALNTTEEHLPSMNGPHRAFRQFLNSVSPS